MTDYPKVSVITTTYNQQDYIRETLQGVFDQSYSGIIEFIISNDCSTDDTDMVIRNYLAENVIPKNFIVKYFNHDSNKGVNHNFIWSLKQASGDFIALCEGDDYWTDPNKLEKQVNSLLKNTDVKICSHPSKRQYSNVLKEDNYGYHGGCSKIIPVEQIIKDYASAAPYQSIMFKNENTEHLAKILDQLIETHSTIQIFHALQGGLLYIPEYMAVYRVASKGSVSKYLFRKDKNYLKKQIKIWSNIDLLNRYSDYKFNVEFESKKKQKAFVSLYSDNLTFRQVFFLIWKYKLYKETSALKYYIKSKIYSIWIGFSTKKNLNSAKAGDE